MPARILHIKTDELQERIQKDIHGKKNSAVYVYKQGCNDCKAFSTVFRAVRDEMATQPIDFYKVRFHKHKNTVQEFMKEHGINKTPAVVLYKKTGQMPTVLRTAEQLKRIRDEIKRAYNPLQYEKKRANASDPSDRNFHERVMGDLKQMNQVHYGRADGDSLRDVGIMLATTVENGKGIRHMEEVHDKPTVLLMYRPDCPHCVNYMPKYRAIADGAPGHVRVLQINMSEHGNSVLQYMNSKPEVWQPLDGVPTVYMVRPGQGRVKPKVVRVARSDMTSDRLLLKMDAFFKDINSPQLGLNPSSVRQDNGIVCRKGSLFGNGETSYCSLEEAVAGNAVVMFHSPTCPACIRAMPFMDKLANELQAAKDKMEKENRDVTEVKVLTVDHPNNLKRVSEFVRRYNDIVLLGGKGRDQTIQIPVYPSVYIFRKDQPYTALAVKPSPNPNAPDKLRFVSLDLLRYAVNTVFPGCGLKSVTDVHYDPLNLRTYNHLSLAAGGEKEEDLVSLFSVKGGEQVSLFSDVSSIKGGEQVSLFSDVSSIKGGEQVSFFSETTNIKGGKIPDEMVSLFSDVSITAGLEENDTHAKQIAKLVPIVAMLKKCLKKNNKIPCDGDVEITNDKAKHIIHGLKAAKSWKSFNCEDNSDDLSVASIEKAFQKCKKSVKQVKVDCYQGIEFERAYVMELHPFWGLIETPTFVKRVKDICKEYVTPISIETDEILDKLTSFLESIAEEESHRIALFYMILFALKQSDNPIKIAGQVILHYHACSK